MEIRSEKINIRCTPDEKEFLTFFAESNKIKVAEVIRRALNSYFNDNIMEIY